jgi:pimeloyl-ACP methyl ester carboxylesterase
MILMQILARRAGAAAATLLLFTAGCGDSSGPGGEEGGATLSGTVSSAESPAPVAGATITVSGHEATSDADGRFELAGLAPGAATVQVRRPGYLQAQVNIALTAGSNSHDFALTVQELYATGQAAIYVPAGPEPIRGAIIVLGGPVTAGLVTGDPMSSPSDPPEHEQGLQAMGAGLRSLARSAHVALIGTTTIAMRNSPASDDSLFQAVARAALASGRPELEGAPVLMVGLSAGSPEAAGLASRHPERATGLLVRVPTSVSAVTGAALAVPTLVMQAELDQTERNAAVRSTFTANRAQGGLWALVVEPGVEHGDVSSAANGAMIGWLKSVLGLRLPPTTGAPVVALMESSGWLGNQTTREIASWADYSGDRTAASWLPSAADATSWKTLGTPTGGE